MKLSVINRALVIVMIAAVKSFMKLRIGDIVEIASKNSPKNLIKNGVF